MTTFGPATSGTATEIPEILRKARRETPGLSCLSVGCFRFGSSSAIVPPTFERVRAGFSGARKIFLRKVSWPDEFQQSIADRGARYGFFQIRSVLRRNPGTPEFR